MHVSDSLHICLTVTYTLFVGGTNMAHVGHCHAALYRVIWLVYTPGHATVCEHPGSHWLEVSCL